MHRIDASGNVGNMFTEGDPTVPVEATDVSADWLNAVQEELVKVITSAGLVLNKDDNTQLWQALQKIIPVRYDVGEWVSLYHYTTAPVGFEERNGAVLTNASTVYKKLFDYLRKSENAWQLKTEAQWQSLSAEWSGVGGVPFYVLNTSSNTIRLPDTRGMYAEDRGFDGMAAVRDVHMDMIREIKGEIQTATDISNTVVTDSALKAFTYAGDGALATTQGRVDGISFKASYVVPTGNANKPRAFAGLPLIYTGASV